MLFRWLFGDEKTSTPTASDELRELVSRSLPDADDSSAAVIGAVAGLCAVVAHADRVYTDTEREHVRALLSRLHGLSPGGVDAICLLLELRLADLAHESLQTFTRVLYERTERPVRLEVLDMLVDLAAADDSVDMAETNLLRRIARGLGLSDDEYVASQARHRERLSVLRSQR